MPTIELDYYDLCELVGKKLEKDKLMEILPKIKCEVESFSHDKLKVEVTPERIDLLSTEGVARALRHYLGIDEGILYPEKGKPEIDLEVEKVEVRPYIGTALIKGVDLDNKAVKSIMQLQEKLHEGYGRRRQKLAIGLHDISRTKPPYSYKEARPHEASFRPLGESEELNLKQILEQHEKGQKYGQIIKNADKYPVIIDSEDDVLSFPPIINSRKTKVNVGSEDIFIDVTGTEKERVSYGLNLMVKALTERGGILHPVRMDYGGSKVLKPKLGTLKRELTTKYVLEVLGIPLEEKEIKQYLTKMGYNVKANEGKLEVEIPYYRSDILHDIDIIEDIAIGYGYNNFETLEPESYTIGEEEPIEEFSNTIRELIIGQNYQEIMTPVLTDKKMLFDKVNREESKVIRLRNPVSSNYKLGRDILLPNLLEILSENTHNPYPQKIFEVGEVIKVNESLPEKTETKKNFAGVYAGKKTNYTKIRGEIEGLLAELGISRDNILEFEKKGHPMFLEGRIAQIIVNDEAIGYLGEINPQILNNLGIEMPISGFEIDLNRLHFLSE